MRAKPVIFVAAIMLFLLSLPTCQGCLVSYFAFHPQSGMQDSPQNYHAPIEKLMLPAEGDVRISAFWIPRQDTQCSLIFFHGNAGNASHRLSDAVDIWEMGMNVLLVDYRGFGLSEGRPSEKGMYKDAMAAYSHLVAERRVPENKIVVYGRSIGSAAAVDLAQNRQLAGVILATPLSTGKDMAKASGLGAFAPFIGNPFDSMGKIGHLRSPLLVVHGTADEVVPYEQGKKLFEAATVKKTFVSLKGAYHNTFTLTHKQEFHKAMSGFLQSVCL